MKANLRLAIKEVERHGALLVFPIKNKPEPLSLWRCFYPKSEMRWEWDEDGDNRVGTLWHLRTELALSRKVVYAKWYQGRATVFSRQLFTALLSAVSNLEPAAYGLSPEAEQILALLDEDSPLPTKQLRALAELEGAINAGAFNSALRELWSRLLIVGYGEEEEGGFPSLAIGSTRTIFEEIWDESRELGSDECREIMHKILPPQSLFLKQYTRLLKVLSLPPALA